MVIKYRDSTNYRQICTRRLATHKSLPERHWLGAIKWSITLILILVCNIVFGFSLKQGIIQPHRISTTRYFRHATAESIESVSSLKERISPSVSPTGNDISNEKMPTWHRHPQGASVEQKLVALRDAMEESSLTAGEATVLESRILEAARGDFNMIAGAIDFCLIMLETTDMDISALVAASFHYCSCYGSILSSKDECPKLSLHLSETISIVEDAAQLKEIENNYAAIDTLNSGNLRKLLLARTNNWSALAIRSVASVHRLRGIIRNCIDADHEIIGDVEMRAARQAIHIYAPLAAQLGMHRLRIEIENTAFQILYRRQFAAFNLMMCKPKDSVAGYHTVTSQGKELQSFTCLKDELEEILAHAKEKVTRVLSEDYTFTNNVDDFIVTYRVKEPYSLWRKALKLGAKSILDVPDALALRIIVDGKKIDPEIDEVTQARDRLVCYLAHLTCSKSFKPLKGSKLKNYVARPKSNGYQSLHYNTCTEFQNEKYPLEIQIRSREMHQVAEFGLAAHWRYKHQANTSENRSNTQKFKFDHSTAAYLSSCGEWHWQNTQNNVNSLLIDSITSKDGFIEALEVRKSMLTRERVYVFLAAKQSPQNTDSVHRNGKLLELSAGACVLDALRESESALGFSTSLREESLAGIMHNGSALTSLTEKLRNGDIISIPTSAQRKVHDHQLAKPLSQ